MPRNPDKKRCTATSKRSGEQCKNWAVPGKNVCRFHGGKSNGAPKNNKNALKTGAYESILVDTMDDDEKKYFASIQPDPLKECEEKIRLLKIRELRMMRRIKDLRAKASHGDKMAMETVAASQTKTETTSQGGEKTTVKSATAQTRSPETAILEVEEALTRVQNELGRWVDRLAKLRAEGVGEDENVPDRVEITIVDGRKPCPEPQSQP